MKKILSFLAVILITIPAAHSQEFLLRDETFTWDESQDCGGGYHYWTGFGGAPVGDWTSPYDYENGLFYFRFEIIDKPTSNPDRFNMCIWTEFSSSPMQWKENGFALSPYMTSPGVYTWSGGSNPISSPWIISGIDWTDMTPSKLWHFGIAHFVGNCNLAQGSCTTCDASVWEDNHASYLPVRLRITIVGVAAGHSFSGWSYWVNGTPPDPDPDPVTPPTPTYSIQYYYEETNKAVPSTDEYAYSPDMSGAISGTGNYLQITPGEDVYFRTKAQGINPVSDIQHLSVPSRPSTPSFAIDYFQEKTTASVSSGYEYSSQSNMSGATTGSGSKADIVPGSTLYFREKATGSDFASSVQALSAPVRPATPSFTIDYTNETVSQAISSAYEYSSSLSMSPSQTGSGNKPALTPGSAIYFRKLGTASEFRSGIQTLTVPSRPATPAFVIDYSLEKTSDVISSEYEYSGQANMSAATSGTGVKLDIVPGTTHYFRKKASASSFISGVQTLSAPSRPAAPQFNIDYNNATTDQIVASTIEYSTNSDMSQPQTGNGNKADLSTGTTMYFRKKATSIDFKSAIQALVVPARPATPAFAIDYTNETTTAAVSSDYEYADNLTMSSSTTASGSTVALVPGSTIYFRKKSTASQFASAVQELVIPARPAAPVYTIDFVNGKTVESIPSGQEHSVNSDMAGAVSGSGTTLELNPGMTLYFRIKSTASSFAGATSQLVVPEVPVIESTVTDTLRNEYFMATVDFHGAADGFELSDMVITNAQASIVGGLVMKVEPDAAGEVTLKVKANAILAGNFESEPLITFYIPTVTSIPDDVTRSASILAYPSPVKDLLKLETEGSIALPGIVELIDISGTIARKTEIVTSHSVIDMSTLPRGLYILKMVDNQGQVITRKVIKQ
jgi:hypothetical protein